MVGTAAIENSGGAAGTAIAIRHAAQVLLQEQRNVGIAVTVDVAGAEHFGAIADREAVVLVQVIRQDFLGVSPQLQPHRGIEISWLDRDEVAIAIVIEIADRTQRALGGAGQPFQPVARVAGELLQLQVADRLEIALAIGEIGAGISSRTKQDVR